MTIKLNYGNLESPAVAKGETVVDAAQDCSLVVRDLLAARPTDVEIRGGMVCGASLSGAVLREGH